MAATEGKAAANIVGTAAGKKGVLQYLQAYHVINMLAIAVYPMLRLAPTMRQWLFPNKEAGFDSVRCGCHIGSICLFAYGSAKI